MRHRGLRQASSGLKQFMFLMMNVVSLRACVARESEDACVAQQEDACVAQCQKHLDCMACTLDYEPVKSNIKSNLIEGLVSSVQHCTLCKDSNTYDPLSSLDTLKSQAMDWVKFRQSMEQHKSCFPALNCQLKRISRWPGIEKSAACVREAALDVMNNDAEWLTRPHIRQLVHHVKAAAKIWAHKPHEVWANKPVIYVRFNLKNRDIYVGQTTDWDTT